MTVAPPGVRGLPTIVSFFGLEEVLTGLASSSRHLSKGGKQITKLSTHTLAMRILARPMDMMLGYVTGRVTATYLSSDMAQRFRMEAVHIHTSTASQMEHHRSPKIHTCNTFNHIEYV